MAESWGTGPSITHLKPTAKLISQAIELTDSDVDMGKLAKNLASTTWGRDLADLAQRIENQT